MTRPVGWFSGFPNVAAHFKPVQNAVAGTHKEQALD